MKDFDNVALDVCRFCAILAVVTMIVGIVSSNSQLFVTGLILALSTAIGILLIDG